MFGLTRACLVGLVLALYATAAGASGFALREWSATAQGNAYAGATAGADDITFMAFNPAGLTRHPGTQGAVNFTYIAPYTKFSADSATTVIPSPITGTEGGDDGAPNVVFPTAYLSHQFSPKLFGGVSVTVPFGLSTKFDDDWVGRYHAIDTMVKAVDVNPVLAYRVTPKLSIGGGLRVMYAEGKLSNAVDFGTIDAVALSGAAGGTPTMDDGIAEVRGDDFGFGYNFGILYQLTPSTRIGAAYRSRVLTNLEGPSHFNNGAVGDAVGAALGGAFVDTNISARIDFPETASFGIHHDISPKWSVMAEAAWTRWSRLKELRVKFDNPLQADEVIPADWKDTWFVALGTTYRHSQRLTARFGVAFDQTPTRNRTRTPRVPDEDRTWVSLGMQYAVSNTAFLDFGYTHLFIKETSIDLSTADPANTFRGNLSGHFDSGTDVFLLQYRVNL